MTTKGVNFQPAERESISSGVDSIVVAEVTERHNKLAGERPSD